MSWEWRLHEWASNRLENGTEIRDDVAAFIYSSTITAGALYDSQKSSNKFVSK